MEEDTNKNETRKSTDEEKRRDNERRFKKSLGHIYISTIGWICRREKDRRKTECKDPD